MIIRFTKYYGTPMWASLESKKLRKKKKHVLSSSMEQESEEDEEDEEEMSSFQQTGNFLNDSTYTNSVGSKSLPLPKNVLDIKICPDANKEEPHEVNFIY